RWFMYPATVRFDEGLQIATAINVAGTREVLLLCPDCLNIKVSAINFIHLNLYIFLSSKLLVKKRSNSSLNVYSNCVAVILFNLYGEWLAKEALDGTGDFKIGGRVIKTVKYADDLVVLAKEEEELQNMMDKLVETGMVVHVSTSFSYCHRPSIDAQFYEI
ncbi:uncharacterized protein LOC110840303, partial [Zootermopsis nevadensis]|uniref:uncharacterized protein LOC110840303 n=1 Tax=Zootermopsis nevadensis TaxID=136037 RepID=UPI000B8E7751